MQNRINKIQDNVDAIRKSGKFPHWRMAYAEFLLTRAKEYIAVDRLPEANIVVQKLERWLISHSPKESAVLSMNNKPIVFYNAKYLAQAVERIRKFVASKGLLVPIMERESINRRLKLSEKWIEESKLQEAYLELFSLRNDLIARLRRSYRARQFAMQAYRKGDFSQPKGSLIGLYNAQHTLEETFHIVGERDPIWIEDFLDIYNELFRIVEKIAPQEKK